MNEEGMCKVRGHTKLTKFCKECQMNLCDKCVNELHERNFPNHELIDIKKKKNIKDNDKINLNNENIDNKTNILYEAMEKKEELKDLLAKENTFLQKIESEKIKFDVAITEIINDINYLKQLYEQKIFVFQSSIEKIFEIINLSYLNYYISPIEEQKQISITKNLLDINYVSKKIAFSELQSPIKNVVNEFISNKDFFKYELQWSTYGFQKSYVLENKDSNTGEDCVTKIIELPNVNKIAAGLIGGQINIWNLDDQSIEKVIDAHKSAIWAMIKLSNNMIASGSSDKTIKIWNTYDFEKPVVLKGHKGTVFCLGELEKYKIISGSEDKTIKIWEILETKKCIINIPTDSKINCLHILPEPGFVLTGGDDNLIKIWNIYSQHITDKLEGHECTIWSIASLNSDNSLIASGSSDNSIIVWDLNTLKSVFTLEGHENTISCLRMMNNELLMSCSWDTTIRIWNLKSRNCITCLQGHKNIVWDVIQLEDGNIASCSSDNRIIVWERK
jgi:WD40 repeat protein